MEILYEESKFCIADFESLSRRLIFEEPNFRKNRENDLDFFFGKSTSKSRRIFVRDKDPMSAIKNLESLHRITLKHKKRQEKEQDHQIARGNLRPRKVTSLDLFSQYQSVSTIRVHVDIVGTALYHLDASWIAERVKLKWLKSY